MYIYYFLHFRVFPVSKPGLSVLFRDIFPYMYQRTCFVHCFLSQLTIFPILPELLYRNSFPFTQPPAKLQHNPRFRWQVLLESLCTPAPTGAGHFSGFLLPHTVPEDALHADRCFRSQSPLDSEYQSRSTVHDRGHIRFPDRFQAQAHRLRPLPQQHFWQCRFT